MNDSMHHSPSEKTKWLRFFGMIATATVTMFFLMYQLVYEGSHLTFSMNRLVSSLVSGSVMTIIMLLFMWGMYRDKSTKMMVVIAAFIAFVGLLFINRGQALIDDENFMKSMIPHHSIAINNARKSDISDPRVRKLADDIIEAQVKEIAEMKLLLEDIDRNGKQGDSKALPPVTADLTPEIYDKAKGRLGKPVTPEIRDAVTIEQ